MDLARQHEQITARIAGACAAAGRRVDEVTLIAVSKRHPDVAVRALAARGVVDFGENLVQAWLARQETLGDLGALRWHLIGPVQTNKARHVAKAPPALLHSLDRAALVDALAARLGPDDARMPVLVQVNLDREPQKAGCLVEDLEPLVDRVCATGRFALRGLMCIPADGTPDEARHAFARLRALGERVRDRVDGARVELSMGMSDDFEEAILEGATLVRVGTALFGERAAVRQ